MTPNITVIEHDGRQFTVHSTLSDDCRLPMLMQLIRSAVNQAGSEVSPDRQEVADWLTSEVNRTSPRTVARLLRDLHLTGDLTRQRHGNRWYYAPTPTQQVMIAAISAPPSSQQRIPTASQTAPEPQLIRQPDDNATLTVDDIQTMRPIARIHARAGRPVKLNPSSDEDTLEAGGTAGAPDNRPRAPIATGVGALSKRTANLKPDPDSAWRAVLSLLQLEMPQEYFNKFLQTCIGHAWEGDDLVVAAASPFAMSWLELPLHLTMAQEALTRTLGRKSGIRYQSLPAVAQPTTTGNTPKGNAAEEQPQFEERRIPSHCPKHGAPLLKSTRIGAIATGEGFTYCPSSVGGKCTFLVHDTGGVMIKPDDPRGEVGFQEFQALLTNGGRTPVDPT